MIGLTAPQMWYEARVMYEAIASADAPGYTPRQWSMLLTQAQENIVMETLRLGFDFDELRRRVVHSLLNTETLTLEEGQIEEYSLPNSYSINLEEDYLHIVKDTANHSVKVKPVSYDFYHSNIENPFESPYKREFWRLLGKGSVIIITDGSELTNYDITYIERPEPIVVAELSAQTAIEEYSDITHCKLDHSIHRQITIEAAKLAHAYTNNQIGYQIQSMESNRSRFGPQSQE